MIVDPKILIPSLGLSEERNAREKGQLSEANKDVQKGNAEEKLYHVMS